MKQPAGSGRTRKHAGGGKHRHTVAKHAPMGPRQHSVSGSGGMHPRGATPPGKVTAVGKMAGPAKPRQFSPGFDVACCSAQALGTLLGWDWERVLDLYWRTCRTADEGASIEVTLAAVSHEHPEADHYAYQQHEASYEAEKILPGHSLILGVELPGAHAIAITPDGTWWSWGEPFSPLEWPGLVVEEAWALWP